MAWFSKNNDGLTPNDYLRATDTVSRPLAVVFILFIILAISAIIFSLFLGGRWLYQNLDGKNTSGSITTTTDTAVTQTVQPSSPDTNSTSTSPTSAPVTAGSGGTSSSSLRQPVTPRPTSTPATVPNTGPTELPNTGPLPE